VLRPGPGARERTEAFAEYLAARGYIIAAINHWRANTWDPNAELYAIPGRVDHEIFVNECNEIGRDEFPEACVDAPGIDRAAIHRTVGAAAQKFFDAALGVTRK